jgi:hypothetical protein
MDNPGLQPSITSSPPVTPPPVPVEQPQIQVPVKKNLKLKKFLAPGLVMILLVGGLFLGKNLIQEKQRPVEKKAIISCPPDSPNDCGAQCCKTTECCCNTGCKDNNGQTCDVVCQGDEPILPSPSPPTCGETRDCGAQTCCLNYQCCTLTGCHPLSDPQCGGEIPDTTDCSATCCWVSNADWAKGTIVYTYHCPNKTGGSCGENQAGPFQSACFSKNCGAEQIDIFPGGENTRTPQDSRPVCSSPGPSNPPGGSPSPSPSGSPSPSPTTYQCEPDTGATWCSNPGAIALTVDHDITNWSGCLAWCKENMTEALPLCQFNGIPRNCWVKNPPVGGINACIWQPGNPNPKGSCYIAPTLACVGLTKDKTTPSLGDQVTFTCEASFSSGSPVVYFRRKVNDEDWVTYSPAYPVSSTTHQATYQMPINYVGDWVVQCRVCTDDTKTTCTTWGQAN